MPDIQQVPLSALDGLDLLPLAQFGHAPAYFVARNGLAFSMDVDDLDQYEMAALRIGVPAHSTGFHQPRRLATQFPFLFALRTYRNAPSGTTDILLPARLNGTRELHDAVAAIASALNVSQNSVLWPRPAIAQPPALTKEEGLLF